MHNFFPSFLVTLLDRCPILEMEKLRPGFQSWVFSLGYQVVLGPRLSWTQEGCRERG